MEQERCLSLYLSYWLCNDQSLGDKLLQRYWRPEDS